MSSTLPGSSRLGSARSSPLRKSSLTSAGTAVSKLGVFDQSLPREVENLEVVQPRGLKVHGSSACAGKMGGVEVPTKTYSVIVEPRGHPRASQCTSSRMPSDLEDKPDDEGLDDRFCFRMSRSRRFKVGRHFPVLVCPRLMPAWKDVAAGGDAGEERAGAESSSRPQSREKEERLAQPTVARAAKFAVKVELSADTPFVMGSGNAGAGAGSVVCDRGPALFSEPFDLERHKLRQDFHNGKERWLGKATMMPTNTAEAKRAFEFGRDDIAHKTAAARARGQQRLESLKERYSEQREVYRKLQMSQLHLSLFDHSVQQKQLAQQQAWAAENEENARLHSAKGEQEKRLDFDREFGHTFRRLSGGF